MKYITIPLMFSGVLTGCIGVETREDYINKTRTELEQKYEELTSGEKTMEKAFRLYELFLSKGYGNDLVRFGLGYDRHKKDYWCLDDYINKSQDFRYRFCNIDYVINNDYITTILAVKTFDKDNRLSDKDRYCMESKCYRTGHAGWVPQSYIHNEDECVLIRRHLLNNTDLDKRCVFD